MGDRPEDYNQCTPKSNFGNSWNFVAPERNTPRLMTVCKCSLYMYHALMCVNTYCKVICHPFVQQHLLPLFTHLKEMSDPRLLINGHACHNTASWSCANGWPSFISYRLSVATVEQTTSSGMNQMKEQIIPSSPCMTCSSDLESVCLTCPSQSTLAKIQQWWVCGHASECACLFSWQWVLNHCTTNKHVKPNLGEWWMSTLNVQYISTELKGRNRRCTLLPASHPRQWSSVCFPMCLSQRLLADLALTWPRKQKICSFLTESTKFNTQPFSPLSNPCYPRSFRPSDNNW